MVAKLSDFQTKLAGGGARANQFTVTITGTAFVSNTDQIKFMCRSASLPALTVGEVPVFYRGRQIYVAGDRTYADWTITLYNDSGWKARGDFERWNNALQEIGVSTSGTQDPASYYGVAFIDQKDRSDSGAIRVAELQGVWPTNVGEIALAYDTVDAIEEFEVTLRFNWMQLYGSKGPVLGKRA